MSATLASHTTLRLGGPCRELVTAPDAATAVAAVQAWNAAGTPWRVMGGGSNLLVADAGIPEAVLRFVAESPQCAREEPDLIAVTGGTELDALAQFALHEGCAGVGFAAGIPGTVGGGLVGNAGAFGRQLGDVVEKIEVLTRDGLIQQRQATELTFQYRASSLQQTGEIVLRAWFRCAQGDRGALQAERAEILALRRAKHPDWRVLPTAGSFFKNLPPAKPGEHRQAAGRLLEQAGAKSMREGGAYVFPRHANIVIAKAGATARDVARLAARMAAAVQAMFGLTLEPEVRYWGDIQISRE